MATAQTATSRSSRKRGPSPARSAGQSRSKKTSSRPPKKDPAVIAAEKEAAAKLREKKRAEAEAFREKTEKGLVPVAKQINTLYTKAEASQDKADSFRINMAMKIADAHAECKEAKIRFSEWCESNLEITYNTARMLLPVGRAGHLGTDEAQEALTKMRARTAKSVMDSRAKQKSLPSPEPVKEEGAKLGANKTRPKREDVWTQASKLKKDEKRLIAKSLAEEQGQVLLTKAEVKKLRASEDTDPMERAKRCFLALPIEQMKVFVDWADDHIENYSEPSDDITDMPEHLRRTPKTAEDGTEAEEVDEDETSEGDSDADETSEGDSDADEEGDSEADSEGEEE